ncbi:hypothetical protein DLJ53_13205 [Acuticoccus sediminis]|uniref:L-lysine 6-oxidase n=1 Tax=Acuticoccus sediminis TaxID=2184697 RepID=A0A8B2P209_9HYPH|nr:LodA/GoxA family CTQ-dependent oxidase [Acuticoccus sediminis]RAI02317.1 hypothetical protein DLJ53_13205 [Acuticoccus sediminis]
MTSVAPDDIAWVAVYPPIGIARLGDATGADDYVLAPEVIGAPSDPRGGYQSASGAIRRQAVRFRIYAGLTSGDIVELVQGPDVAIAWRVEVANLKAGWYAFNVAMDLPAQYVAPAARRNAAFPDRAALDIRPGARTIAGANAPPQRFDDGTFAGRRVDLGEIRTDGDGRLLVLGGHGRSAPMIPGTAAVTFANNDGWHDDIADGPVRATVTVAGTPFEAAPGYVVVTPPNYAPGLLGLVTMDDAVRETFMAEGWLPAPATTRFTEDVWPIFDRLTGMQWINHGFLVAHGVGSPLDARNREVVARLADAAPANRGWRERVLALFRDPAGPGPASQAQMPMIYGDLTGETNDPGIEFLTVTATQYAHLTRWAAGDFTAGTLDPPRLPEFASLPPAEQVGHLNRAGLTECLGGPFHPGIELTWPMRRASLWARSHTAAPRECDAYRLHLVPEGTPVRQDFGETLTRDTCLGPNGPNAAAGPGALTRWLGVPWQTDEASCNSSADYAPSTYLSFPSFWGTRVPEQVLSSASFGRASSPADEALPLQRLKHAFHREDWLRDVRGRSYRERINNMVALWQTLGVVEPVAAPRALVGDGFPGVLHVEVGRDRRNAGSDPKIDFVDAVEGLVGEAPVVEAAGPAPAEPVVPPRHRFRQGEV